MRKISLSMLAPDMILAKPIYHRKSKLLNAGTPNLIRFINNFEKLGIQYLYIEDQASEGIEIPDAITDTTRVKCKTVLEDTFVRLKTEGTLDIGELMDSIDVLLDDIVNRPDILISLNDIGTTDDNTLVHSINATVYSLILAQRLQFGTVELKVLATGTLLHDIGKILLNQSILFKPDKLTESEFNHVKQHTVFGYEILRKNSMISELSRQIALHHHERLDGSGYPDQLVGDKIHPLIRISSIADVFEALIAERCYRGSTSTHKAVEILMQESTEKLDANMLLEFLKNIAIYPNGSTVRLSNKQYGIVKEQNSTMPFRPVIRVINQEKNIQYPLYDIDLMERLDITIVEPIVTLFF